MALTIKPIGSNMTELHFSGGVVLFSYQTPVAYKDRLGTFYHTNKKWSNTTTRHINKWLNTTVLSAPMPQEFFDNLIAKFDFKGI